MSLREFPPEQSINRSRWRHLRYVPLIVLVTIAAIMIPVGYVVGHREVQAVPTPAPTSTPVADRLPESCHPAVTPPAQEPWQGASAVASETTWLGNASELRYPYVLGENGRVFWGDIQANNFSQAVGRRSLSADELGSWHTYLADLDKGLAAEGIPLYIVVAPADWSVYPQDLPEWAQGLRGSGPLDQLMAAGSDLPLVDLRSTLQAASSEVQTYSTVNSHWSDYGAYVGWNAVADCIKTTSAGFDALTTLPISGVTTEDHNEFAEWGLSSTKPDWTTPTFVTPLQPVELAANGAAAEMVPGSQRTAFEYLPATTDLATAQVDKSLLLVGDSFGAVMSPYLQQAFSHTQQVRHNFDGDPSTQPDILALARQSHPDVVILEIAQRHLNFPPTPKE